MMFVDIAKLIEERVQLKLEPNVTVIYDDVLGNPKVGETTIRITDVGGYSRLIAGTKEAGRYRFDGVLVIEVYTPTGKGKRSNDQLCDFVAMVFRSYNKENIKFNSPGKQRIGEKKNLFQQNVIVNYKYDACYPYLNGVYGYHDYSAVQYGL